MASFVSHLNQFPCKSFSLNPPQPSLPSKPSVFHLTPATFEWKAVKKSTFSFRPEVKCSAEKAVEDGLLVQVLPERERLKTALISLFVGTERGLKATSDERAQILELVSQLEAENPNPQPTEALSLLSGKWVLAYTSFHGLFPLLSSGAIVPFIRVEEISQAIDSDDFSVQNLVQFGLPLGTTSVGTNAKFQVRSPKRVQIKFEEGIIGTPKLTNSIVIPEKIELLGQIIDLSNLKALTNTVEETTSSVVETINSHIPFKFSIPHGGDAESWLLTTYLDEDLRISWGDGGGLFILIKEGSALLLY